MHGRTNGASSPAIKPEIETMAMMTEASATRIYHSIEYGPMGILILLVSVRR